LGYRDSAMIWNDLICGALIMVLGALSLSWRSG
jgi:SPW repeat